MNLLLDTHALLWWLDDHPALSQQARAAIADGRNLVFVSAVTIWELRIKQALGKLELPEDFQSVLEHEPFEALDITAAHAWETGNLPDYHRDPFDRLLIAQAKVEGLTLVTRDAQFRPYRVPLVEA